jgi:hypothetical protein
LHSVEPLLDHDYLAHTSYINNWDLVDVSCGPIVGGYLQGRDRAPLYGLARSTLIWERRIAMISTQQFLRSGESKGPVWHCGASAQRSARPDPQSRWLVTT